MRTESEITEALTYLAGVASTPGSELSHEQRVAAMKSFEILAWVSGLDNSFGHFIHNCQQSARRDANEEAVTE